MDELTVRHIMESPELRAVIERSEARIEASKARMRAIMDTKTKLFAPRTVIRSPAGLQNG